MSKKDYFEGEGGAKEENYEDEDEEQYSDNKGENDVITQI